MLGSPNRFKIALSERKLQIGLWCSLASAVAAEVISHSEFDWLLFDSEHAPNDIPELLSLLYASSCGSATPGIRPSSNDPVAIKRVLDLGARTLLIPYIQSEIEALEAVQSTRYPPHGIRGVSGSSRASKYGRLTGYLTAAERDICILLQVETKESL